MLVSNSFNFNFLEHDMHKTYLNEMLRKLVHRDLQNHIKARKRHDTPWLCPEALNFLKTLPLSDEQIQEEIESRKTKIREIKALQKSEEYYLELEVLVFRRLQRDNFQRFPNSLSINHKPN